MPLSDELRNLNERVARLERNAVKWRRRCILMLAALGAVSLGGARLAPQKLTASRLAIVDEKGLERVIIGAQGQATGVILFDSKGRQRCDIAVDEGTGATVSLHSSKRYDAFATLGLNDKSESHLILKCGERTSAKLLVRGNPGFTLTNEAGETLTTLPTPK